MMLNRQVLHRLFDNLVHTYGPQHWWPAETPFEVMVGAVLTQNTAWQNVEKAIENLKHKDVMSANGILSLHHTALADLIRPSGYFNVKARRLRNFCKWYVNEGGFEQLEKLATETLRRQLLSVNGIGPETADDILLYAFDRPVFVIDAYTRRLFSRLEQINGDEGYEQLRAMFERSLDKDAGLFNEFHALIVRHAKEKCTGHQDCLHCLVESL